MSSAAAPPVNYDEAHVPACPLPDPLTFADGSPVRGAGEWRRRREELLELFRTHVYGRSPGRPDGLTFEVLGEALADVGVPARRRRVAVRSRVEDREHTFELTVFLPAAAGPVGAFLLLNIRPPEETDPPSPSLPGHWPVVEILSRGYAAAALQVRALAPDEPARYREGVIGLFEPRHDATAPDAWRALGAWAWGASRAMDALEAAPEIDAGRVALIGHSRGGKAALWAGAQDERFRLVISNESGCGGAAISRRKFGETLAHINGGYPHWFCGRFRDYDGREEALPVDQHLLLSLIAPRPLYVASAAGDLWADPRGEFLALAGTSPAYGLFGQPQVSAGDFPHVGGAVRAGVRGYHLRPGPHGLTGEDWRRYLDHADVAM